MSSPNGLRLLTFKPQICEIVCEIGLLFEERSGDMARAKIVIVGGGFGGVFTALELANAGDITLVSDQDHFLFKPLL